MPPLNIWKRLLRLTALWRTPSPARYESCRPKDPHQLRDISSGFPGPPFDYISFFGYTLSGGGVPSWYRQWAQNYTTHESQYMTCLTNHSHLSLIKPCLAPLFKFQSFSVSPSFYCSTVSIIICCYVYHSIAYSLGILFAL